MSKQVIVIDTPLTAVGFESVCNLAPGNLEALQSLENYIAALMGGNQSAELTVNVGATAASATFTVTSTGPTNTQAGTLLNETFTAVTSGATPADGEFNISATPATVATGLALAINTVLDGVVLAVAEAGVVTVTVLIPGAFGNGLEISAGDLSNVAAAAFSGGSDGSASYVITA